MPKTVTPAKKAEKPSGPQSGAEVLARIKPQRKEVHTQILMRPDLYEAWEKATAELHERQVKDAANARLASGQSTTQRELAKRVQKLEEEIEATSIWFRFRAMTKDEWQALCDDHPPRADDQLDRMAGYNRDAVMDAAIRESLYDPVFDDESWAELLATINPGEWGELRKSVAEANAGVFEGPKSALASRILSRRGSG